MIDLRNEVNQKVESLRDYIIATTQELVRTPSINHPPTGDELACQIVVAEQLRGMGLEPNAYSLDEVPGLKDHPTYFPGRDYSNRPNVAATRKGVGEGRSLVLSGHIDTVPLGTKEWKHDPFGAEIEDDILYGLGAFDMKAGVATNLCVLRVFQELQIPLKGDLIFETVVDEEFGGVNGTIAGRLHGERGDAYVISEPTALAICNGGKGGQVAHITLEGPEGIIFEGSEPGHAIRNLAHFLKWVDIFRQRRRGNLPGWQPGPLDPIPLWVTKISAGGWGWNVPITTPADVKVELYMQLMPGETEFQVRSDLFDLLDEMVADKPNDFKGRPQVDFPIRFMPGSEIPIDSPLITALNRCAIEVFGHPLEIRPLAAPSDLYTIHLDFNSPGIHFGVRGGGAHAADEYILLEDLVPVMKTLALLALDWCGAG
jgi:acetylornithine deacetylase